MTITVENNNHTLSEGLCTACSAIIDILGDVNHDGFVTILDLVTLNELFLSQGSRPTYDAVCDLNGDGIIDVLDAILLRKQLFATF